MDDFFLIYQDSLKVCIIKKYLKRVEDFINFILSNLKNISGVKLDIHV
jgi:hypothetical protein